MVNDNITNDAKTSDKPPSASTYVLGSRERDQLDKLLNALCDGPLSPTSREELTQLLESAEARSLYIQFLHLHANLAFSEAYTTVALPKHSDSRKEANVFPSQSNAWGTRFPRLRRFWPQIAASMAVVIFGVWMLVGRTLWLSDAQKPFDRTRVDYVACVVAEEACRWAEQGTVKRREGLLKSTEPIELLSGLAKVRFDCGAEVILRGPAKLQIESGSSCILESGELTARVPEVAKGFVVKTPLGRVVDLGTAFGVRVGNDLEVQVFEGACELFPHENLTDSPASDKAHDPIDLPAGTATRISLRKGDASPHIVAIINPKHAFTRSLANHPDDSTSKRKIPLAVDAFGQGGPGTRLVGRTGGFGWADAWNSTPDSDNVSFLLGTNGVISRGSGSGVVQRRLQGKLAESSILYFSAEIQIDGPDARCSAWIELFHFLPHNWANGDTDLAVIGITDGQFSGRLAPFGDPKKERSVGDCGRYIEGTRHLIVGKLEFDAVGKQERFSIWINPSLADEPKPDKVILRETGQPCADAVALRCWEFDDQTMATFDEVRVGLHWIDVVR